MDNKFCVINEKTGGKKSCHASKKKAQGSIMATYYNKNK